MRTTKLIEYGFDRELVHPTNKQINIVELVGRLTDIRDKLYDTRAHTIERFPYIDGSSDCRITGFSKLINVLNSTNLGCAFWAKNLSVSQWWLENTTFEHQDQRLLRMEFQIFLKLGLFHFTFSAIESTVRCIARGIDPLAHHGSAVEFKRVYDDLFRNKLSSARLDFIELLDFFSALRNTIHNNGVYFHRSGSDVIRYFKGGSYHFNIGQKVDFAGWPLLIEVLNETVNMLIAIVLDTKIISIQSKLADPATS